MSKILVTGASGDIGKKTVLHLLKKRPASELIALVRDPAKAEDLAALGVELRQGDYLDRESLTRAFRGAEKLMLTSTHAFTDRKTAHANVIDVAAEAGVQHLVYMPIYRKAGSTFTMTEITEEDIFSIERLRSSGVAYTLVQHPPFMEPAIMYAGPNAVETGVRVPAGNHKFTAATRDDLAAAHAAVLTGTGHEGKSYYLSGAPAVSWADIARILSEIHGKDVPYIAISDEEYIKSMAALGFPDFVSPFILKWVQGMNQGEWEEVTNDLETLIGRKPTTPAEYLRSVAEAAQAQKSAP
ncbi:NAD(P)H-binding protein [Pinirhizobacter soli]|uniref:NAD(P)H-binding protein n=1 Tax=Pinirhizobacter soli TaxID=2786953 RepID=UPI00202A118E|nr:NAD(P)H-binding protein [Pinirhizobacter soli]